MEEIDKEKKLEKKEDKKVKKRKNQENKIKRLMTNPKIEGNLF